MWCYRKKPVVIEAFQFQPAMWERENYEIPEWAQEAIDDGRIALVNGETVIRTLEDGNAGQAKHVASPDDWIIKGVKGELYPCKPDIFASTYDKAEAV